MSRKSRRAKINRSLFMDGSLKRVEHLFYRRGRRGSRRGNPEINSCLPRSARASAPFAVRCPFQSPLPVSIRNARCALKLESESNLPFSSRQHLRLCSKSAGRSERAEDCSRILTVQQVEKLEQHLHFGALADIEPLGKAHIKMNIRRRRESISTHRMIDAVQSPIAVRVYRGSGA